MNDLDTKPWYRQFWPWFLISLPATVVVASLFTVYLAVKGADTLVDDNYYRDGLAINQVLTQDDRAVALAINATVKVDSLSGEIFIDLSGKMAFPPTLRLVFLHPADERRDLKVLLQHTGDGHYRADLEQLPVNRYYLRLQPGGDDEWRVNGEADFSRVDRVTLHHNG